MRQDIKAAVRPVLFQTDCEDWPYSQLGTLFVVNFHGWCYGITCKHVIGERGVDHLLVFPDPIPRIGVYPVPIANVTLINGAENELQDIAIIRFAESIRPHFFGDTAYRVRQRTVGSSEIAHRLKVYGYLGSKTTFDNEGMTITGGFCDLQFTNVGERSSDPFIRQAIAYYSGHNIDSLDGVSGAPVYDATTGRLCGMAARGGLTASGNATLWYIDIFHVMKVLAAVHEGRSKIIYQ